MTTDEQEKARAFAAVLGEQFTIQPPPTFAEREDVVVAWGSASRSQPKLRRMFGAVIGLCYPDVAKAAGANYAATDYDVLSFGSLVYEHLRAKGASVADLGTIASALYLVCLDARMPREKDVVRRADFIDPPAVPSTDGR
jgi:hypothetical protein